MPIEFHACRTGMHSFQQVFFMLWTSGWTWTYLKLNLINKSTTTWFTKVLLMKSQPSWGCPYNGFAMKSGNFYFFQIHVVNKLNFQDGLNWSITLRFHGIWHKNSLSSIPGQWIYWSCEKTGPGWSCHKVPNSWGVANCPSWHRWLLHLSELGGWGSHWKNWTQSCSFILFRKIRGNIIGISREYDGNYGNIVGISWEYQNILIGFRWHRGTSHMKTIISNGRCWG